MSFNSVSSMKTWATIKNLLTCFKKVQWKI